MALMKINEFRKRFSSGSAPDPRTVKRWWKNGEIYGEMMGGCLYVDPDVEIVKPKNSLVIKVLATS